MNAVFCTVSAPRNLGRGSVGECYRKEEAMKYITLSLVLAGLALLACPAFADSVKIAKLINATESDYESVKSDFQEAHRDGGPTWEADSRDVQDITNRITARREAIRALIMLGMKVLPADQRGLFKLVLGDLDRTNLSLLALIKDERGYTGYSRTGNEELVKGIADWQEGIRQAIRETKRCAALAVAVTGPFNMRTRLGPMQAH
jgi:hypothetical protein